jgi:SpoVK/Ycf46/Vps4 family AAA+-type ATPase
MLTGKTTVAKLYARILVDLGLLSKGEVVIKNPSDFVGSVIGSSEANTRAILAQAEGSVLVIDEAYGLNPSGSGGSGIGGSQDPYKTAVIDTIVEQIQGVPGEDRAVVMLGYRKPMEAMFAVANPGLARRFQLDNAFEFSDYDDNALRNILVAAVKEMDIKIDLETAIFAISQLDKARALPNFGNGGAVNNLLSEAKKQLNARQAKLPRTCREDLFIKEDFCKGGKLPVGGDEENLFSDLVGCEDIISKLQEYRSTIKKAKQLGKDPKTFIEYNFLFVGSPGKQ